jgi:hypothetical protein
MVTALAVVSRLISLLMELYINIARLAKNHQKNHQCQLFTSDEKEIRTPS